MQIGPIRVNLLKHATFVQTRNSHNLPAPRDSPERERIMRRHADRLQLRANVRVEILVPAHKQRLKDHRKYEHAQCRENTVPRHGTCRETFPNASPQSFLFCVCFSRPLVRITADG